MSLTPTLETAKYKNLADVFGYQAFRPGQEPVIDALVSGQDALAVMPTGGGKSICYQIPALLMPGITIVVSPLISLMQDQVQTLVQAGVRAAYINSSLSETQCRQALTNAKDGLYKIVYVAPERLLSPSFLEFAQQSSISLVCVDEAHCVSQWGQDFRPSYLQIPEFLSQLDYRPPVGAFTATATARVREDIGKSLRLQNPLEVTTGFDRPNLYFEVQRLEERQKYTALKHYIEEHNEQSGIVYCSTRKKVDSLYQTLSVQGVSVARYHAGLTGQQRTDAQQDFVYDRVKVMVATNAFGMGIDKSNVSYVVHYNMPMDMESYYQEAGRAGRDGQPADCILLYAPGDVRTANFLIDNAEVAENTNEAEVESAREKQRRRLKLMTFYCHSSYCLRGELLKYFGQRQEKPCGHCSVCEPATARAALRQRSMPKVRAEMLEELPVNEALWKSLKELRATLSRRAGVPAFVVFTDATLRHMCAARPTTEDALLQVPGVGNAKCARYGKEFLALIQKHCQQDA